MDWATLLLVSATLDRSKLESMHGGDPGGDPDSGEMNAHLDRRETIHWRRGGEMEANNQPQRERQRRALQQKVRRRDSGTVSERL